MKTFNLLGILRIIIAATIGIIVVSGFGSYFIIVDHLNAVFGKPVGFLVTSIGVAVVVITYIATVEDEKE